MHVSADLLENTALVCCLFDRWTDNMKTVICQTCMYDMFTWITSVEVSLPDNRDYWITVQKYTPLDIPLRQLLILMSMVLTWYCFYYPAVPRRYQPLITILQLHR